MILESALEFKTGLDSGTKVTAMDSFPTPQSNWTPNAKSSAKKHTVALQETQI